MPDDARSWLPVGARRQGLGLMRLRDTDGTDADRDPRALVHAALDAGVLLLDTAEMYGNEELVGRALAGRRDEAVLCTKFGVHRGPSGRPDDWSVRADAATVRSSCDASLRRLDVEHIDLYYLHHRSDVVPIEETVSAMAGLVEAGKIGAVGLSNVTVEDVRRAQAVHPVAAVQEAWSLTSRGVEAMLPVLDELGVTLVAHSPTAHGALRPSDLGAHAPGSAHAVLAEVAGELGADPGQVALAWVHARGRDHAVVPLPGASSRMHLRSNVEATGLGLGAEQLARLEEAFPGPDSTRD